MRFWHIDVAEIKTEAFATSWLYEEGFFMSKDVRAILQH